jgi:ATP/maltotriose-dependent transcriptional regulator MalT
MGRAATPETASALVARPSLRGRLTAALDRGSVLIVAGAGYGKTTVLEQTLAGRDRLKAWVSCASFGGDAGLLLLALIERVRRTVPGSVDVLVERLETTRQRVDVVSLARLLRTELEQLLVEPLVLVLDDGEELEGSAEAVELVDVLLHADPAALRLAVASRRPLELRTAKLAASGRLAVLSADDLAFSDDECAELLARRHGRVPTAEEVGEVMTATQGWPLGIALSRLVPGHAGASPGGGREAIFGFLREEVLDGLDDELRAGAIDAAVPLELTAPVLDALGLPPDFPARAQRAGLLLRAADSEATRWSFHPLFREFLRGRLETERPAAERRSLHGRVAAALSASGLEREAIEHWLEAGDWTQAMAAAERLGQQLLRVSPDTVRGWLDRLPPEAWHEPGPQFVRGQLEWGAGRLEASLAPLRAAVTGYDERSNRAAAWLARWILCDSLFTTGRFDELERHAEGWDEPDLEPLSIGVAWYCAFVRLSRGQADLLAPLVTRLHSDPASATTMRHFAAMLTAYIEYGAGRVHQALDRLSRAAEELEEYDPANRAAYARANLAYMQADCGLTAEALDSWGRLVTTAGRAGYGWGVNTARWHRAFLYTRAGELARAEEELDRAGTPSGAGFHDRSFHLARAAIAVMRDEPSEAVAAAERALELVNPGVLSFRIWTACDVTPILVAAGAPKLAHEAIAEVLDALTRAAPGDHGRFPRARLLALRAWLREREGDAASAADDLGAAWADAAGCEHHLLRAEWERAEPLVGRALAEGRLDPAAVIAAAELAFPGGGAVVSFVDHPEPGVRRAALPAAAASGHPGALAALDGLTRDPDAGVAAAARATQAALRRSPPPLRFQLLGRFGVRRATWEIDKAGWGRPLAARLVRFLLVHRDAPVPEDLLFEAFWPEKEAAAARHSLAVTVSLARKALDPPGAPESVIYTADRLYQLRLRPADRVDADDFDAAAATALAAEGPEAITLLERAESLWGGDPLPEDRYVEWTFVWRERLTDRYAHVLAALTRSYTAKGATEDALRAARKFVELDPLNEAAHRELMASYARAGRRNHALRQYLACRRALVDELGIEPSEATASLQARILAGEPV